MYSYITLNVHRGHDGSTDDAAFSQLVCAVILVGVAWPTRCSEQYYHHHDIRALDDVLDSETRRGYGFDTGIGGWAAWRRFEHVEPRDGTNIDSGYCSGGEEAESHAGAGSANGVSGSDRRGGSAEDSGEEYGSS